MAGAAQRFDFFSEAEYLDLDDASQERHEFWGGQIVAMAGATPEHVAIAGECVTSLNYRLRGSGCRAGSGDLQVRLEATGNYVYPDVVVWCRDARFDEQHQRTLLTPIVVIEVLSPSTASYDRGIKSESYRAILSLTDYLPVSQDRINVEHFSRAANDEWVLRQYRRREQLIQIRSLNVEFPVDEIYREMDLPEGSVLVRD